MPTNKDAWGIEVGANAIKAVRLQQAGNSAALADFEVLPFKKILTTPELDVDEAIRVGLDQFLAKHRIGKASVVVSLPGHTVLARSAKLPPVEPKRIGDIVRFEAVQQIPFPIEQVEWDYQTFQDPDSPDVEVGIFAVTKQRLMPWIANFQSVGLQVHGVCPSLAAVYNAISYDQDLAEDSTGTVLMDIGTQATDLVICEGHRFWPRTIPIGGNHFTEALVKSFKLSFSKAEKLKREASTSKYARQIFQAMRPVFVDLVQEVQKSLGYYQSLNRSADLTRLVGMGATFRLPGLQTFLKQQLQIKIQRLDEFKKLEASGKDVSTFGDNVISLAPAYGLALQGLEMERVSCNLLPEPMIRRQLWKAKRPWFAAAAAIMLAATLLAYGNLAGQKASYNSSENERTRRQTQSIIADAEQAWADWRAAELTNDPRDRIANANGMLAYRRLWGWVMRDLDRALMSMNPQPAVLAGDTEVLTNLARRLRRVFYIEQVSAVYSYTRAEAEPMATTPRTTAGDGVDWETSPPTYTITIVGTTPYNPVEGPDADNPVGFVDRTLIESLRSLEPSKDRPYRTAVDPQSDTPRIRVANRETVSASPDRPTGPRRPRRGGLGGFPGPREMVEGGGGDEGEDVDVAEALLPERLPGEAVQPGDTRIEIEWVIELRPPDREAREEAEAEGGVDDEGDGGAASDGAAARPGPAGAEGSFDRSAEGDDALAVEARQEARS